MNTTPYWIDTASIKPFPHLSADHKTDVLVVGAGITGITAAYLLKGAGRSVTLIERARAASIDTGHTTAHLTYVTDFMLRDLVKKFGQDHAQATWDAGAAAIDKIESIVREEKIDCEFCRLPSFVHAPVGGDLDKERPILQEEVEQAIQLGFDAAYVEQIPFFKLPGARFANQAKFHPRKYLAHLIATIPGDGSHVFEESAAGEFDAEKRRVKVNGHWIEFDRVVMATNNPLVGLASVTGATVFQTKLSLYSSYVIGAKVPRGALPMALFWDTKDPYDYLRIDRHEDFDYAIFGGEDYKTGQVSNTEDRYLHLIQSLTKYVPEARVDHRWSGQVILTNDGLPYIGQNADGQFIATGYYGNGITFGTIAGVMACDWVAGIKNPWSDLFDPERKKFLGGTWDYLRENKDYPYYLIKDRLLRAEADSVREIEPGGGMIVKSAKGKVAACRDQDGTVHKVSAICPHMGCIVHWNSAEKTWDCPCHGSRFKPTGEVISGPAEAPLAAV